MGGEEAPAEDDKPPSTDIWDTGKPPKDLYQTIGFKDALKRTYTSPYVYANAVYIVYAAIILSIDLNPQWDLWYINNMFVGAAVVHVVNACMYIYVWLDAGYPLVHRIMIPEFLNILEASLYMATASMYGYESFGPDDSGSDSESGSWLDSSSMASNSSSASAALFLSASSSDYNSSEYYSSDYYYFDPITHDVQCIELAASLIELLAACGWVTTWYFTYQRVPGRGFTFDDPDMWANCTIIAPAIIYVVYNVQTQLNPASYGYNFLYVTADKIYMANATCYFVASLRDAGWFWFMPTSGSFPYLPWSPKRRSVPAKETSLDSVI